MARFKDMLAERMGLPPVRSRNGLYLPGRTYYSLFGFFAVRDVFIRKDDFWSDSYNDVGTSEEFGDTILKRDGTRHRRHRDLIQQFFQPRVAEHWWRRWRVPSLLRMVSPNSSLVPTSL